MPVRITYYFYRFIRDYKGLDILLKAIADKRFKDQNINEFVAGEFYNNADQYCQLIDELDIADLVTLRVPILFRMIWCAYYFLCIGYCGSTFINTLHKAE